MKFQLVLFFGSSVSVYPFSAYPYTSDSNATAEGVAQKYCNIDIEYVARKIFSPGHASAIYPPCYLLPLAASGVKFHASLGQE